MKVPFRMFEQERLVPLRTWKQNEEEIPANPNYTESLWVERGEDWYALLSPQLRDKSVLVVTREDWLKAVER